MRPHQQAAVGAPTGSTGAHQSNDSDSGHAATTSSSSAAEEDELEPVAAARRLPADLSRRPRHKQLDKDDIEEVDADEADDERFEDADGDFFDRLPAEGIRAGLAAADSDKLEQRLEETTLILRMALNNEFARALDICSRRADKELYASLAHATLSFLRAALTLEQADLQSALASITQSFEVSGRARRRPPNVMLRLLYPKPDYNRDYSDHQIHAELVHAESLLLLALISFLADQSIICFVRGAFRIRACYQRYKECLQIMETRREGWSSELAKAHFESGVRMGYGIFNLLMSYLPRRVLRFLEYVGFSGKRCVAVAELDKSVELDDGLRSVFSTLVILTYHSYIENLLGLGSYDSHKVEQLNNTYLGQYPNSAFFLLFRGRYHQMQGNLDEAVNNFQACIEAQDDWKQFHAICHWEMMWCYAVRMDWRQAAHYADLLRRESKWSAASYTYQYASFLYAQLLDEQRQATPEELDNKPELRADFKRRLNEIHAIMECVPTLRIRYAGKTIPAEKFAITRAAQFCAQQEELREREQEQQPGDSQDLQDELTLPALEFFYIWNIFATLRKSPEQVQRLLDKIDAEIEYLTSSMAAAAQPASFTDRMCLLNLLRGMCMKHLDRLDEAEECFMSVVDAEPDIDNDTFLVPHCAMEIALLKLHQRHFEEARLWIKTTRANYTGYLLETMVHFRLHAASRVLRLETAAAAISDSAETKIDSSIITAETSAIA